MRSNRIRYYGPPLLRRKVQYLLWKVWYIVFSSTTARIAARTGSFLSRPALAWGKVERAAAFVFGVLGPFHNFLSR